MSLPLEVMTEIAQPLDEWCDFCTMKLATRTTSDGQAVCEDCAAQFVAAIKQYEAEAREAERALRPPGVKPKNAKAKAKRRAKRKRTKR